MAKNTEDESLLEKAAEVVEEAVDKVRGIVEVELAKHLKQERIGNHTIFTPNGAIEFVDGLAKTTKEQADYLKETGHIK